MHEHHWQLLREAKGHKSGNEFDKTHNAPPVEAFAYATRRVVVSTILDSKFRFKLTILPTVALSYVVKILINLALIPAKGRRRCFKVHGSGQGEG